MEQRDIVSAWRALIETRSRLSDAESDEQADALTRLTRSRLVENSGAREAVLEAFRHDSELRNWVAPALLPPTRNVLRDPAGFLGHPEVNFTSDQMPLRTAVGLPALRSPESYWPEFRKNPLLFTANWFGGSPALPRGASEQPERSPHLANGRELSLVVQIDLGSVSYEVDVFAATGLPEVGVLQLFHDLETDGWDADSSADAWHVAWYPDVTPDELVLPNDARLDMVPINAQLMATAPSVLDLPEDFSGGDRYQRSLDWLEQAAHLMNATEGTDAEIETPWDEDYVAVQPVSRLGGFPYAPQSHEELQECLHRRLPLADGDAHCVLFDINPLSFADDPDWFQGGRHLEVWMRTSDLSKSHFGETWSVIRTDS